MMDVHVPSSQEIEQSEESNSWNLLSHYKKIKYLLTCWNQGCLAELVSTSEGRNLVKMGKGWLHLGNLLS